MTPATVSRSAPYGIALALFSVTTGVNLQAPLYAAYAAWAGRSAAATALVFCCYAATLVPCLLMLGGLSDRLGRRVLLLASLGCSILASVLMAVHGSFDALIAARLLQGLSVGLSFSAGAAWLREVTAPERAAFLTTASTAWGFGVGPLATFAILEIWPQFGLAGATPASYWAHPLLAAVSALLLLGLPVLPRRADAPVPPLTTLPLLPPGTWPAGLGIFIGWAAAGLVIAVVPRALREFGLDNWSGLCIFLVTMGGFAMQPLAQRMAAERAVRIGLILPPVAFLLMGLGTSQGWLLPLLAGAVLNGMSSFGFAYLGGLRVFQAAALAMRPPGSQARAAAGYFLWVYFGFSLPALGGGALADAIGFDRMLLVFGAIEIVLAIVAFAGLRYRR